MDYLDLLNTEQKKAALRIDGPLLVVAGAGAGKTKTICHRILHIIKCGVAGENILAITFTNKAAKEMRDRVMDMLSHDPQFGPYIPQRERPFVSTFHALGVRLLRDNAATIGLKKNFLICDRSDSLRLVKDAIVSLGFDTKQHDPHKLLGRISRMKGDNIRLEQFEMQQTHSYGARITASVWRAYEKLLRSEEALDFDDLLAWTVRMLENHAEIRNQYANKWTYIHIDEYQDTNIVQNRIATLLAAQHRNICVVGDADQTIYTWRGATIENIMEFEKQYPDAAVVILEENYRSTQNILTAANDVIKKNTLRKEKTLYTKNGEGEKITLLSALGSQEEAEYVAATSGMLINMGARAREIAVLYRANFLSRSLEEAFLDAHVPYQVLGIRFYERKEIKDLLSYVRAALNPSSLGDIKRIINVPPRGIGKVTLLKMFAGEEYALPASKRAQIAAFRQLLADIREAAETKEPSACIKFVMERTRIEATLNIKREDDAERLENMKELVTLASRYDGRLQGEGMETFLSDAALASDQDALIKNVDAVKLMTIHAAKGLEFDCVFIVGLEEGIFPNGIHDSKTLAEFEEERRLFYVALTRARKKVYLTYANTRTVFGQREVQIPSEFIADIDEALLSCENSHGEPRRVIYID